MSENTTDKGDSAAVIDLDSITPAEWYDVGRKAVEDVLIEWRDARLSILNRNNGLVVKERDGSDSSVIRMSIEDALRIGVRAIVDHRAAHNGS